MAARWRKEPNEQGLASVCQSTRGLELREKGEMIIMVSSLREGGWYWYGMGQNTCGNPVSTMQEAKDQATKFYKENRENKLCN